jgi:hypothetical protein
MQRQECGNQAGSSGSFSQGSQLGTYEGEESPVEDRVSSQTSAPANSELRQLEQEPEGLGELRGH